MAIHNEGANIPKTRKPTIAVVGHEIVLTGITSGAPAFTAATARQLGQDLIAAADELEAKRGLPQP